MKHQRPFSSRSFPPLGLALACALLSSLPLRAADNKPNVDARADEMLKRMGDYLGQAKFFTVSTEIWQDIETGSGQRIQAGRNIDLQVRRPDRLRAEVHSPRRNREMIYDGKGVTLLNRVDNFYGTAHVTGSLDNAMDVASEKFGITMPLEDFVRSDPHRDLLEHVTSGRDIGPVTVMGVPCEHLAFSQDDIDWQIWIENGARPVPRKFVITYKDEPGSPQFTAIFSDWDFTTILPDFLFKFEPPPGSSKIKVKEIKAGIQSHKAQSHHTEAK
jgi:hypothetical protein